MAELSIAPHAANILPQAAGSGNESRSKKTVRTETSSDTPVSFAATLKSKSEKSTADPGKDVTAESEATSSTSEATATPPASPDAPVDPATLLAQLKVDSPAPPEQTNAAAAVALSATAAAIPATRTIPATPATPGNRAIPATPATPAIPAAQAALVSTPAAASPAPTFPAGGLRDADSKRSTSPGAEHSIVEHGATTEPGTARNRLAAETAIPAAAGEANAATKPSDLTQESFHAAMYRIANPALADATQMAGAASQPPATHAGLHMATSLGQPGWPDEMGQKLTWMTSNNRQQAELILNPPQLGRIEVTLTLDGPQASASFTSPHAAVREALENSMTRLREVLADAGVTLGQTHVGSGPRHESGAMNSGNDRPALGRTENERHGMALLDLTESVLPRSVRGRGMVDIFA